MSLASAPIVRAEMLIRRPVDVVFNAFIDPTITTKFWFTRGSAPLKPGTMVSWHWDMYGVSANISVVTIEPNHRILILWPNAVEWHFAPKSADSTFVTITTSGFQGSDDEVVSQAIDNMGGFSLLLAGCKAWLEHGIQLNLIADHTSQP